MASPENSRNGISANENTGALLVTKVMQEMEELRDETTRAIQVRDEFISIASHELKTPLTVLFVQIQMLARELEKPISEIPHEKMRTLATGSLVQMERLSVLVEELLDLTRITAGKLEIRKKNCNLTEIVLENVMVFKRAGSEIGHLISVRANMPILGFFDSIKVGQIVTNLMSNAVKYGDGKPIVVTVERSGDQAFIEVKDQGPGIPLEKQKVIFHRFERANSTSYVPGLGLGLYICKEIVTAHKGSIQVQSVPGKGAIFTVILPVLPS